MGSGVGSGTSDLASVNYRVVSSGLEITNTTAEINQQGTVTSVRVPSRLDQISTSAITGATGTVPVVHLTPGIGNYVSGTIPQVMFDRCQMPPPSMEDAMRQGAVQWKASDGTYCVNAYEHSENEIRNTGLRGFVMDTNGCYNAALDSITGANITAFATVQPTQVQNGTWEMYSGTPFRTHVSPRDTVACYFTGLSKETTLTLTTRYYVEISPRDFDLSYSSLVPLAYTPPPADKNALDAYQIAARGLPPAVPVGMNPSGEFWSNMMDFFGRAAKVFLPIILPGPEGAVSGALASKLADLSAEMMRQKGTIQRVAGQVGGVKSADISDGLIRGANVATMRIAAKPKQKKKSAGHVRETVG